MRILMYFVAIVSCFASGFAQTQDHGSTDNRRLSLGSGARVEGQLQKTVDVRKARVGDEVVLKLTKELRQNGEVIVPKGAKLLGRVTEVQQNTSQTGGSRLGLLFDKIEGKNLSLPVSASIISVNQVAGSIRAAESAEADVFGSSTAAASTRGGGSTGGGLVGGVGSTIGGVTNTAGGVLGTTTKTVGGVVNVADSTAGSVVGGVHGTANGLRISNSLEGSARSESTLSASKRDIRLEQGAVVQLLVSSSVRGQ
jgi:hypothetical protein